MSRGRAKRKITLCPSIYILRHLKNRQKNLGIFQIFLKKQACISASLLIFKIALIPFVIFLIVAPLAISVRIQKRQWFSTAPTCLPVDSLTLL